MVNASEIDRIFEKLREAEHGAVIKLGLPDSEKPVEAIIFEPAPSRPAGHENGVFVTVPSDDGKVFYLDPEASREQGRLILKVLPLQAEKPDAPPMPEDSLGQIRQAPDIKRGGGTSGETCSKHKGIIDAG
jgi:hypothetical protein